MALLAELGLAGQTGVLLVSAPDSVLAEAARSSPRPSFVSSLRTAHPAPHIVWWPDREMLTPEALSRLHWMLQVGEGQAWLVTDPNDDDSPGPGALQAASAGTNLHVDEGRQLTDGSTAHRCIAPQAK
jgi:hypothetical protein